MIIIVGRSQRLRFLSSDLLHTEPIQIEADIPEMFMVIERGSIKYNLPSN